MTNNDFGKVAVLMGGASAEREISLLSGRAVLAALLDAGVDAFAFDPLQTPIWELPATGAHRVFNILHGGDGENGVIQGALDMLAIPYTGSGVLASALAMDKVRCQMLWRQAGLPTPRSRRVASLDDAIQAAAELGLPLVLKPISEGSSIGVVKVHAEDAIAAAWAAASVLPDGRSVEVMAEEFVAGVELTAALLDGEALPLVRIDAPEGRYDYHNKYFTDAVRYSCPAGLSAATEAAICAVARAAFNCLGCRGWGRADVILRDNGDFVLLEMNTIPGMTSHSLAPMAAAAAGIDFNALVLRILAGATT